MPGIKIEHLSAAQVVDHPTYTSRRLIRREHGAQGVGLNVSTLHAGYEDAAVTYPDHDEIVYVLTGKVELTVDGQTSVVGPGTAFYVPRGATYGYKVLEGPNDVVAVFTPGKF
jgi:quercetin dioxygenase-like cupin family protein